MKKRSVTPRKIKCPECGKTQEPHEQAGRTQWLICRGPHTNGGDVLTAYNIDYEKKD